MSWNGILENVISDVLFCVIAVALGWALLVVTRQIRLLDFFGVRRTRKLVIYLPSLRIRRMGAIGIDGRPRSYGGEATAFLETTVASRFRDLLSYPLPCPSGKTGLLSRLLFSDVQVDLNHSPLQEDQLDCSSPLITLGSPVYNIASWYAEERLRSRAQFRLRRTRAQPEPETATPAGAQPEGEAATAAGSPVSKAADESAAAYSPLVHSGAPQLWVRNAMAMTSEAATIDLEGLGPDATAVEAGPAIVVEGVMPTEGTACGFVERVVDPTRNRCVFYVAGISELATAGAAHFLLTRWRHLHRKHPKGAPFLVVLRVEADDYRRWSVVLER